VEIGIGSPRPATKVDSVPNSHGIDVVEAVPADSADDPEIKNSRFRGSSQYRERKESRCVTSTQHDLIQFPVNSATILGTEFSNFRRLRHF
jgi:hypothetical protein